MSTFETLDQLQSRILAGYSLLFLNTSEEERWQKSLATLAEEMRRPLVSWSATEGAESSLVDEDEQTTDPLLFLKQTITYPPGALVLIKDLHPYLDDPQIVRTLRDLAHRFVGEDKTLFLMGPVSHIPVELAKRRSDSTFRCRGLRNFAMN